MSEDNKSSERATEKQVETITKNAKTLYRGTASTVIGLNTDYKLLNAIGKGDKGLAGTLLNELIDKTIAERIAYKAKFGSKTMVLVNA